uniref:Uncharacterized protein n=1 Tax=Rhizophora mucronata TaxID=61149 RepID=A0A2P2PXL4_RHIMU
MPLDLFSCYWTLVNLLLFQKQWCK